MTPAPPEPTVRLGLATAWALAGLLGGCQFDPSGLRPPVTPDAGAVCGNGRLEASEGCDDSNTTPGDGCNATCQTEPGWACAGEPSVCTESCGDGRIDPGELCDDGNATAGDGCNATCQTEPGWACAGEPSICTTICGDGLVIAPEQCDDGNATAGDGCDASCQPEPGWACTGEPSVCTTICGDGLVKGPEQCDDGNATAGDGCDATCQTEPGWACTGEPSVCTTTCGDGWVAGDEACDDGNGESGDGCDSACQVEPFFACGGAPSQCTCVVYVNRALTTGTHDGSSWSNALSHIQPALDAAESLAGSLGTCDVWVAAGTYPQWNVSSDDGLRLRSRVGLYGGFAGGETLRSDRDPSAHPTVLEGANPGNSSQKVHHVVRAEDLTGAVLDGFHLQHGKSPGEGGGGLRVTGGDLLVQGCWFQDNQANYGGAVYARDATVQLLNVQIHGSTATVSGGAVAASGATVTLEQSEITGAHANGEGGAIYLDGTDLTLHDTVIQTCTAAGVGGGIRALNGAHLDITSSHIDECEGADGGGLYMNGGTLSFTRSRVTGCRAIGLGAGLALFGVPTVLTQTILAANQGGGYGGGAYVSSGSLQWVNGLLVGNRGNGGAGLALYSTQASLQSVTAAGNQASVTSEGGALYASATQVTGVNLILWANGPTATQLPGSSFELSYSVVQGGASGDGNLSDDPLLVDPDNGDFHLLPGSPAIDAADGDHCLGEDLEGTQCWDDPATQNSGVGSIPYCDIGAYEYH